MIEKIITHAFIEYNVFPYKLCKTILCQHLYGSANDQDLLQSFLNYLPYQEKDRVEQFSKGLTKHIEPVIDILSESKIFMTPTKENINDLCIKAATMTLIPYLSSYILIKGIGHFWNGVTYDMFNSIYICTNEI